MKRSEPRDESTATRVRQARCNPMLRRDAAVTEARLDLAVCRCANVVLTKSKTIQLTIVMQRAFMNTLYAFDCSLPSSYDAFFIAANCDSQVDGDGSRLTETQRSQSLLCSLIHHNQCWEACSQFVRIQQGKKQAA